MNLVFTALAVLFKFNILLKYFLVKLIIWMDGISGIDIRTKGGCIVYTDQIKLFIAVAEHQSISRAAMRVNLSQSAASQSIAKLEKEIGTELFARNNRGLELNREGMVFYQYAKKTIADLEIALQEINNAKGKINGLIRLQILATSAQIPQLISDFISLYPEVQFKMVQNKHIDDFDVCITTDSDPSLPERAEMLWVEKILLAVPPDRHPFSDSDSVFLEDAKDENFIMMRDGSMLRALANSLCLKAGFEPRIVFESDNPSIVRDMISKGLGVAFIPQLSWSRIIDKRIHLLQIVQPESYRRIFIYSPERIMASKTILTFIDFAKRYYQSLSEAHE